MKLLQKAKKAAVKSKGFLTKRGALVNYKEVHSLGLGIIDGLYHPMDDYIERLEVVREIHDDVDSQPHYFMKGHPIGRNIYIAGVTLYVVIILALISWVMKSW